MLISRTWLLHKSRCGSLFGFFRFQNWIVIHGLPIWWKERWHSKTSLKSRYRQLIIISSVRVYLKAVEAVFRWFALVECSQSLRNHNKGSPFPDQFLCSNYNFLCQRQLWRPFGNGNRPALPHSLHQLHQFRKRLENGVPLHANPAKLIKNAYVADYKLLRQEKYPNKIFSAWFLLEQQYARDV